MAARAASADGPCAWLLVQRAQTAQNWPAHRGAPYSSIVDVTRRNWFNQPENSSLPQSAQARVQRCAVTQCARAAVPISLESRRASECEKCACLQGGARARVGRQASKRGPGTEHGSEGALHGDAVVVVQVQLLEHGCGNIVPPLQRHLLDVGAQLPGTRVQALAALSVPQRRGALTRLASAALRCFCSSCSIASGVRLASASLAFRTRAGSLSGRWRVSSVRCLRTCWNSTSSVPFRPASRMSSDPRCRSVSTHFAT